MNIALNDTTKVAAKVYPTTYQDAVYLTICFAFLSVWSVLGNGVTFLAIATQPGLLTKSNIFILSMTVSDFFSGLISSPLFVHSTFWGYRNYNLPDFFCNFFFGFDEGTSYATSLHIASFAVWRFYSVKWPIRAKNLQKRKIKICVTVIWFVSAICAVLFGYFFDVFLKPNDGSVLSNWPDCGPDYTMVSILIPIYIALFLALFVFPFIVTFIASSLIVYEMLFKLKFQNMETQRKQKKAVGQLSLILLMYVIGYLPQIISRVFTTTTTNKNKLDFWLAIFSTIMLRLSECLNPVVYNTSSEKIFKASVAMLHKILPFTIKKKQAQQKPDPKSTPLSNITTKKSQQDKTKELPSP